MPGGGNRRQFPGWEPAGHATDREEASARASLWSEATGVQGAYGRDHQEGEATCWKKLKDRFVLLLNVGCVIPGILFSWAGPNLTEVSLGFRVGPGLEFHCSGLGSHMAAARTGYPWAS